MTGTLCGVKMSPQASPASRTERAAPTRHCVTLRIPRRNKTGGRSLCCYACFRAVFRAPVFFFFAGGETGGGIRFTFSGVIRSSRMLS